MVKTILKRQTCRGKRAALTIIGTFIATVQAAATWPEVIFNNLPQSSWDGELWWVCAPWGLSGTTAQNSIFVEGGLWQMGYTDSPGKSNETITLIHRQNDFVIKIDCANSWSVDEVRVTAVVKNGTLTRDVTARGLFFSDGNSVFGAGGLSIQARGNFPTSNSFIDSVELTERKSLWSYDGMADKVSDADLGSVERMIEAGYASDTFRKMGYSFGGITKAPEQGQQSKTYSPVRDIKQSSQDRLSNFSYNTYVRYSAAVLEYDLVGKKLTTLDPGDPRVISPRVGNSVEHLPLGEKGMLISVGGKESVGDSLNGISYSVIDIFDIENSTWHKQNTTGDAPPSDISSCTVLADLTTSSSTQASFVLYLYGHTLNAQSTTAMWALYLPSFHWTAIPTVSESSQSSLIPTPRDAPVCKLAANRHLILIGGRSPTSQECLEPPGNFRNKDTGSINKYPFGVSTFVYDLVKLEWSSFYDSRAKAYDLPKKISDSVGERTTKPEKGWGSQLLQERFEKGKRTNGTTGGEDKEGSGEGGGNELGGLGTGGVVGLAIGIAVVIAIVVFLVIWLRRRSKVYPRTTATPHVELDAGYVQSPSVTSPQMQTAGVFYKADDIDPPRELPADSVERKDSPDPNPRITS